jgi:carbon-monoxide dehydrogenase medium subunit
VEWFSPTTVSEACRMLCTPGARIVAGCTAVPPRSLLRYESGPLIDLSGLVDLRRIARVGDRLRIGAMVTLEALASDNRVAVDLPLLAHAARQVGDAVVRRQATIGGNLMARGGWELPATLLALGTYLRVAGPYKERTEDAVALCDPEFALGEGEVLVAVELAAQPAAIWSYRRATTNGGAFLCAVAGTRGSGGANLFLAGGANHPLRLVHGREVPALRSDALASGAYRRRLVSVLADEAAAELAA